MNLNTASRLNISKKELMALFALVVNELKSKYDITSDKLITTLNESSTEIKIPLSIFSTQLSPSEALSTFLKERCNLRYRDIAVLINRDERGVWNSYKRAARKRIKIPPVRNDILMPVSVFRDRKLSILENAVIYLKKNYDFTISKIAELLNKDPSTIATSYYRAKNKLTK